PVGRNYSTLSPSCISRISRYTNDFRLVNNQLRARVQSIMEGIKTDIKALFLEKEDCDAGTVQRLRDGLSQGPTQYKALRDAIDAMKQKLDAATGGAAKKWQLKLGIASFFMGRIRDAAEHLKLADSALAQFYLGRAHTSLHEYDEALKAFER